MEILKFYTKPDCPLCDQIRDILHETGAHWEEIHILSDPDLWARYRHEIPVLQGRQSIWFYRNRETEPLVQWLKAFE